VLSFRVAGFGVDERVDVAVRHDRLGKYSTKSYKTECILVVNTNADTVVSISGPFKIVTRIALYPQYVEVSVVQSIKIVTPVSGSLSEGLQISDVQIVEKPRVDTTIKFRYVNDPVISALDDRYIHAV
jgi:hypothetical protein